MRVNLPRDIVLYELGLTRDMDRRGARLLGEIADSLGDRDQTPARVLHEEEKSRHQQATNIDACFKALGVSPLERPVPVVEALRERFFNFARLHPPPEVLNLYALGTALRHTYLAMACYRDLIIVTELAEIQQCQVRLKENLDHKERYAARLERYSAELGRRLLVPA